MTLSLPASLLQRARLLFPGVMACAIVAAAATFLSEHYGAPVMLFALLLGIAMNYLAADTRCKVGIDFTAREVLRIGVALLGLRITFSQIAQLGWEPVLLVIGLVVVTISMSMLAARLMGFQSLFGFLTGGATAICGASAAMAMSAALPAHPGKEKATLFTIIGVSTLSTLAMVLYPMLANAMHFNDTVAGIFLGATIHDVAQVVGAGYSMSSETGDTATVVKLMRVAMLLPVIICAAMITRARGAEPGQARPPLLPWFAVGFILLAGINSTGLVPALLQTLGNEASRWCLVLAISAIGMKTQLKELAAVGLKPILLMVGETVFLVVLVMLLLSFGIGA